MQTQTAHELQKHYASLCSWSSLLLFPTGHDNVDLSPGLGSDASPLAGLPFQPEFYPHGTTYQFDPETYLGASAVTALLQDVELCFPQFSLYRRGIISREHYTSHRLCYSFSMINPETHLDTFCSDSFSKIGTKMQSIKRRDYPTSLATNRMNTSKMSGKKRSSSQVPAVTISNSSPSPKKRRTIGVKATDKHHNCPFCVHIRHYHSSNTWFLAKCSTLQHKNHVARDPQYKIARASDISLVESNFAQLIYNQGGSVDVVTRVMNEIRKKNGDYGRLKLYTLRNLLRKHKVNLEFLQGIDPNWTISEKTIQRLQCMGISYIALVSEPDDELLVYKGKGQPPRKEMQTISADGNLKKHLRHLHRDLKLQDSSRILLALSVSTTNMICTMYMFPEVLFVDAAANMKRQKRDIFFPL